jgi:hypothetical protein
MDEIAPITETEGIEGTLFDPDWPPLWFWEDFSGYYENELKWRQEIEAQIIAKMDPMHRKALG